MKLTTASDRAPWEKFATGWTLLLLDQEHGKKVARVTEALKPEELSSMQSEPKKADAWLVNLDVLTEQNLVCGIRTADCFPVLMRSKTTPLAAVVHCGWKGAQLGLLLDVITQLARLGAAQRGLEIAIGPGAQSESYEIKEDVASKLEAAYEFVNFPTMTGVPPPVVEKDGKKFGAIANLLTAQAVFAGVPRAQIAIHEADTISSDRYFSYRREKEEPGRQLTFLGPKCP